VDADPDTGRAGSGAYAGREGVPGRAGVF
jgi:hypothetical protein